MMRLWFNSWCGTEVWVVVNAWLALLHCTMAVARLMLMLRWEKLLHACLADQHRN